VAFVLLILSGLFSGLNLGLMSLDITMLKILQTSGTKEEQGYANKIEPIRRHGNFLLCTLLLGNVLVNSSLTILLDTLFGGLFAVIGSTAGIVIMGEIIPQAICQRFGLVVGAKTLFITKIFMVLTAPLSWPISKILDKVLGDELGTFYRREQLKELVRLTQDHHGIIGDEFKMISGVLDIKDKQVKDIMTDIRDVFMLNIDTTINFQQLQIIIDKGFSRIPVWEEDDNNIVGLLFVKDLAFVDPENNIPLRSVIKFYKHKATKVYPDCNVFDQMQDFMTGKYHMAIVQEVVNEGSGDPFYKTLGVLTLEDIIEEIIQQEIIDETDVYEDNTNRNKVQRARDRSENPFKMICSSEKSGEVKISRQLRLATYSFLSTSVAEFSEDLVSSSILHKLLKQDVIRDADHSTHPLVEHGKACDAMIMILSGEVVVTIGKEQHQFTQGPFSVFCENALKEKAIYIPDVTVTCPEKCQYLYISRQNYRRAVEATCYEKTSNAEIISFSDFANAHCDDGSQCDVKINGDRVSYTGGDIEKGSEQSALGGGAPFSLGLAPVDTDEIVCDERTSCLSGEDVIVPISLIEKESPPPYK
jgi:metal transporter CNNM